MGMATYNNHQYGDGSWAEDAHWGSYKFFFTKIMSSTIYSKRLSGTMDAKRGSRYVVRNSKLYDCPFIPESWNRRRPGSGDAAPSSSIITSVTGAPEAKDNPGALRSGNILFHDNKYTGVSSANAHRISWCARTGVAFQPWALAARH